MTTNIDAMAIFYILSLPTVVMHSSDQDQVCAATDHYGCQTHRQLKCPPVFRSNQEWHPFPTKGDSALCQIFHSGSVSAGDNGRAGSAISIDFVPPRSEEDAERLLPYLLRSHDNTLRSSSCQLPPTASSRPTACPGSGFQHRQLPKAFSKEERSVWNSKWCFDGQSSGIKLPSTETWAERLGLVCHSCCTLLLWSVIRNDLWVGPRTVLFSSLMLLLLVCWSELISNSTSNNSWFHVVDGK